ncbi:hypothetical protein BGX30_004661, partial [Mortierella sp. GBA39]
VVMSCVLNTMSERVCDHFKQLSDEDLVGQAISLCAVDDFEKHPSLSYLEKYSHKEHHLTGDAGVEDKVLQVLIHICCSVIRPLFHNIAPSEADCLQLWASVFGILAEKISIHTGEIMLEASRNMREWQIAEYGDVSEAGRKVDCLSMFDGVELLSLEIKHPDISKHELAIQNKKRIRLARCIQEAHVALGVKDASVFVVDVC